MPTLTYATGFEYGVTPVTAGGGLSQNLGTTGGSSIAISSSTFRSGAYSLRMQGDSAGSCYLQLPAVGSSGYCVGSMYVRFATLPGSGFLTIYDGKVSDGSTLCGRLSIDSTGQLSAIVGSGSRQTGPTISTGQWYRIEWLADTTGTTWNFDWSVNGVAQTRATEGGHAADTGAKNCFLVAADHGSTTTDCFFDDLAFSVTSADYPLGGHTILNAPLEGTASHQSITTTQWQTTSDFSSFTNFTGSGETTSPPLLGPPISTATASGIRMNTTGAVAGNGRWPIAVATGAPNVTARGIAAIICVREASTGTNNATFRAQHSASTTNYFSGNPGWGTTWNYLLTFMTTLPGSAALTPTNIDAMNFEADSTDASPNIWLQGVVHEVVYPEIAPIAGFFDRRTPRRRALQRM